MKVIWTEEARDRLKDIEAYIAQENPTAAKKLVRGIILKVAEQLTLYPSSGKTGRLSGTRELVFSSHPYIVVYTVMNDKVYVLTVFHGAQKKPLV
ncbi:type II toxin-antitoxin system RelE/ParE family toxin [Prosthecochloris sp. SCSIO W1101]|uniref:type II toxin-antitoxin system RelE/ParE family toxin n=1 Tax=Prosthecochloris sp. SCSIO W1101 TaxID=2992242 RepID=UPI00223CED69|nr:type II toxin-antitoxin system RelE/ParE family toxin [Prosthecochloris sp. SCSIO W1101]UZJ40609.1 type II toxin-antitoxin system RelE/ParE family toxin [Prosthecochloris sp. SCSIO W1101]